MSKKDFQAFAAALYAARPHCGDSEPHDCTVPVKLVQWEFDRDAVAGVLAASNPRFNRALFIEACNTGRCKGMRPKVGG